jgi:mono/diheme cytochrome c family protein
MRALSAIFACALPLLGSSASSPPDPQAASSQSLLLADPGDRGPDAKHDDGQVRPILARHCLECHGVEKPKGDFRLDRLSPDFADAASRERWLAVLKRVQAGEMPPKAKPRPSEKELQDLSDWITGRAEAAEAARRAQGRVVLRRLNRTEYENTVCDLLGVQVNLKEQLPQDGSADGFDNAAAALHTSSFLLERYLEAADTALNLAVANRPKPTTIKKRYSLKETHQVKVTTERVFRHLDDAVVCFCSSAWQAVGLSPFYPAERGHYRFRISAYGFQSSGKPVTYRVTAGGTRMTGKRGLVGYFDAPADKPTVVEFVQYLEPRTTSSILPYGLPGARTVHLEGADNYKGPGLAVQWVEVEGPLHDTWPPPSHYRIFGDLAQAPAPIYNYRDRVEVVSKDPVADAERILRAFAGRAFRRTVTEDDIQPFLDLVKARLAAKHSFEQAVRVGLLSVLVSPEFLFLREKPGKLDDFALASRLSYFLWSTMPDEELLTLAEQRKLSQPETLHQQVERMLNHPKASAFTENFVGQWLGLRDIDFTEPSHILYPEFDHMLKVSMIRETELFFTEILREDLSLTNFVAADFAMLNGRLAKHYGIPAVDGWEFRKVPLPADSHRGGVLTMASVLKVTANGTHTSPIVRGAWVLDRILGTPPAPPPEGVSALEPDIRGATTIREQLAKHRQLATCASCHAKIDPPGFALESFDVIGGWRENYRTSGRGQPVMVDGQRMPYLKGPKVDPADVLPDGQRFGNIDDFKQLLLKDRDQLARALTEKLLTYATGGAPGTVDKPEVEAIVRKVREKNYGFRTLVHEIVQSKLFENK